MGTLDVVLDETASSGEAAVLRIASLISREAPTSQLPTEQPIARLAQTIRRYESAWQSDFWETVLQPSVRNYCLAEALAVAHASLICQSSVIVPRWMVCRQANA
jgi:hypothetical protein